MLAYFDRHPAVAAVLIICSLPPVMLFLMVVFEVRINFWRK
jgi:hypothetical protein